MRIPFRVEYSQGTGTATLFEVNEVSLTVANLGPRIVDAGDIYTQYRIDSFIAESVMAPMTTATTDNGAVHGLSFSACNPVSFVTPTNYATIIDMPVFNYGNAVQKVKIRCGPSELWKTTPTPWYNTSTAGPDFIAGTLEMFCQSQSASNYNQIMILSGVAEFRNPIDPADVPLEQLYARVLRDRERLEDKMARLAIAKERKEEKGVKFMDISTRPSSPYVEIVPPRAEEKKQSAASLGRR